MVLPNGSKRWILTYRFNNKSKEYSIGTYPTFSLLDARKKRHEIKKLITNNIDPNEEKKKKKLQNKIIEAKKENTFYNVSQKWLLSYKSEVSEDYHIRLGRSLKNYLYPSFKNIPIEDIKPLDVIKVLQELKERGVEETANRTATLLNKIYKYAVTHELTPRNIIADIDRKIVLGKKKVKHYPTFTKKKDIKGLLNSIDEYQGSYPSKMALKVLPYLFVRSSNIRMMQWEEINFEAKEWTIPAHKMKTKIEFILPLPNQVIALLEELKTNVLSQKYVFSSPIYKDRPLSNNTLISALRRMGYTKEEFVPHSFRAMFSTIAYENANKEKGHSFTGEVIEALLSHKEPNKIKEAYNRSIYKEPMRGLIEWYADYLDEVKR